MSFFMLFFVPAIFSGLMLLVLHLITEMYFPKTGKLTRYVMGVLGLLIPPSMTMWLAGAWGWQLFWACAVVGGGCVWIANKAGDRLTSHRNDMNELDRLRMVLDAKANEEE